MRQPDDCLPRHYTLTNAANDTNNCMLLSPTESLIIDAGGPTEPRCLWLCDTGTGQTRYVRISAAGGVAIRAGLGEFFAIIHGGQPPSFSAHRISSPEQPVSRFAHRDGVWQCDGDVAAWESLPRAYTDQSSLYLLDVSRKMIEHHVLTWFDERYDKGYQAICGVTEVPGTQLVLISLSRDSNPVLYDTESRRPIKHLALAGRQGNPRLQFRRRARELWADDYDTLLRIDAQNWENRQTLRVQPAMREHGVSIDDGGTGFSEGSGVKRGTALEARRFIGQFSFNLEESACAVARPFSGDVLLIDMATFRITHRAFTGRQPMRVALLNDRRVFARDWTTGELLASHPWQDFTLAQPEGSRP